MRVDQLTVLIAQKKLRFFKSSDILNISGDNPTTVSHLLERATKTGLIKKLRRGVWSSALTNDIQPYEAVSFLVDPWPAYVSLYSALSEYGLIAEIPSVIYAVSSRRAARFQTPLGAFHFHHLPSAAMTGYREIRKGEVCYKMALPEKAFVDTLYLSLVPRSPIRMPKSRSNRWRINRDIVLKFARAFDSQALIEVIKSSAMRTTFTG